MMKNRKNNILKVLGVYMLLILFSSTAYSQDKYFVKDYQWYYAHEAFDIQQVGDTYVIAGTAIDSNIINWQAFNIVIDETGEVRKLSLDEVSEWITDFAELYCENDVCYSVGSKVKQSFTGSNRGIGMVNPLNSLDYDLVEIGGNPDSISLYTITKSGDKLFGGGSIDFADGLFETHLYIVEFDESLSIINEYTYDVDVPSYSSITHLVPAPDGGLYVAAEMNFLYDAFDSYMKFMHIDSLGNIITEQNYNLTGDPEKVSDFILLNDGNLMVCLQTMYYAEAESDATVLMLDSAGVVLNSYFFEDYYIGKLLHFENGDFLTLSTYGDNSEDGKGKIQRVDSYGNVLWERVYDGILHQYFHSGLFQDGDDTGKSGYVVCGRNDTLPDPDDFWAPASMWLLKLNCLGYPNDPKVDFDYSIENNTVNFHNKSQYLYLDEAIDAGSLTIDFGDGTIYEVTEEADSLFEYEYQEPGYYNVTFTGMICNDILVVNEVLCVGVSSPELSVDFDYDLISQENYIEVICTRTAADIDEWNGVYSWDFGDGTILETNDSVVTHNYFEEDSISIKLESSPICQEKFSKIKNVSLLCETLDYEAIDLNFTIEPFYYGDSTLAVFTNTSMYPDDLLTNFTWNFGDGNSIVTDEQIVEHVYYATDSLAASLFSEEICGTVFIHIESFSIETGLSSVPQPTFTIYPNPTHDFVQLVLAESGQSFIEIVDVFGKRVYANSFNKQSIKIDVSTFNEGVYFVKGMVNHQSLKTQKIVVSQCW